MNNLDDGVSSNRYVEGQLDILLRAIGEHFESDVLTLMSPMRQPVDELVRDQLADLHDRQEKILVLLETGQSRLLSASLIV
jgi:hypothetical protein